MAELPRFLTVEQAAKLLQLGRSKTYELTVEWERTRRPVRHPVRLVRQPEAHPARRPDALGRRPARPAGSVSRAIPTGERAAALRRELGPVAWCALECLVERSDDGRTVAASVRARRRRLGVAKNTAHRALRDARPRRARRGRAAADRRRPVPSRPLPAAPRRPPRPRPATGTASSPSHPQHVADASQLTLLPDA